MHSACKRKSLEARRNLDLGNSIFCLAISNSLAIPTIAFRATRCLQNRFPDYPASPRRLLNPCRLSTFPTNSNRSDNYCHYSGAMQISRLPIDFVVNFSSAKRNSLLGLARTSVTANSNPFLTLVALHPKSIISRSVIPRVITIFVEAARPKARGM